MILPIHENGFFLYPPKTYGVIKAPLKPGYDVAKNGPLNDAAWGLFVADADEPFGPLNDLFVACFGTFLLKEEPMGSQFWLWTKIG